ncbi:MAG: class II aldolase/adducin family protein [Prolixibacteraceae bacterium]|jgi:ribulose-5-phosphate 4-epimerase/fuculose-1-phosphate aldolase|nr:class II aldolase/adducin family protein [Prolixibacteraceae bacterium]
MDEGYIKFSCNWIEAGPLPIDQLFEINRWRDNLYKLGYIGVYDNGVGFGNISIRFKALTFIITGSATGGLKILNENHYVMVNEYNLRKNSIKCTGPIIASSESLSHAVIYECSNETNAVIHIHNFDIWEKLIHKVPTTRKEISYGTPGMATEIKRLFKQTNVGTDKIIAMAGHKEGIIVFGKTLDEAGQILLKNS